jgi:16S rRNA (cytosine967-C5)-methyltransferase
VIAPARQAAYAALVAHEVTGTDVPSAVAAARASLTDVRDQALLTELVTGVLRMRRALDHQLAPRTSRPLEALDPDVRTGLRLGAFQLLYLDRLPASAVVHDAVALTKRSGKTSAGALVNAVLRALARDRGHLQWPETPPVQALAVRLSHPDWLVERWAQRFGLERTEAWLRFNNLAPRLCLAVNRLRSTREEVAARLEVEGVRTEPTTHAPNGLHVVSGAALATGAYRDGWFVVQDEASQLIAALGEIPPGARALDLCASPGGKTMTLAGRAPAGTTLVACDVRPRRVRLLAQTVARLGLPASVVRVSPTGDLPFADAAFDFVLIDAPCSGLGTLRRDPDIRWSRQPDDLPRMAAGQLTLLRRARRVVALGGTLVYATCSSEPDENEDVVAGWLAEAPEFTLRHVHRSSPLEGGLEAFYAAVLVRNV